MTKGKKNLIALVVVLVLAGALAGLYFWQMQRQQIEEAEATPAPTATPIPVIIEREEGDVESATFTADGHTFTLAKRPVEAAEGETDAEEAEEWYIVESPDTAISQTTAQDMIRGLYYLSVTEKLFDQVDNPAEFGINPDKATATATYTDGTQATLHIGKMTPAKDRYYTMLEGDPAVYLIYTYFGERFFNTEDQLIDRALPTITSSTMEYIYIKERDKEPIEFGFLGTEEEKQTMLENYGTIYVTMLQPYQGRELYYSNFENLVLNEYAALTIGDMVELKPEDLSPYGLDNPSLEVWIADAENKSHVLFGDKTEDGKIYCKFADRPHVFLTDYSYVQNLYGLNVFSFIERFVTLVDITQCETIDIKSADGRDYHIVLNHFIEPPAEDETESIEAINPSINGQYVQDLAFRTFYQRLISLSYDVDIPEMEPTDEPLLTVTYNMIDQDPIVARYYSYDANFLAVQRDDNPVQFVTSLQSIDIMYQSMADLLAGRLDREY